MLEEKFNNSIEQALKDAQKKISTLLGTPEVHMMSVDDVEDLANLDVECFEDLCYDAEDFKAEIELLGSYGVVVHMTPLINTTCNALQVRPGTRLIVGYISGRADSNKTDRPEYVKAMPDHGGYILSSAVHPGVRKQGIFTHMLRCFEDLTRIQDYRYIRTNLRTAENPHSKGESIVFQKTGFKKTGVIENWYDQGDHICEMIKTLR